MSESRFTRVARALLTLVAASLPLYVLRWQYGPFPTTLLENLILATVAFYLIGCWREGSLRFHRTWLDVPIVLLLVSGAIAVIVARDHRAALGLYRAYFIEPIAIFYVAAGLLAKAEHFRSLLVGFAVGTAAFAILNVAVFVAALVQNRIQWGSPPSAIYGSANEVAMFLEPPLAFGAALVLIGRSSAERALGAVWTGVVLFATILTFSRGGFLAIAAFVVFVIVSLSKAVRRPLLIAFGAGAIVFASTLLLGSHTPVVIHRLSLKALEYTSVTRFELYGATLQMIVHHPLFGLGIGGYLYVYHNFPEIYPHDLLLTFWVELGILGLVAFAYIYIRLMVTGWRALPSLSGFEHVLSFGALGSLVLWAVHGIFDTPYWKNDMSVEFWIVAAILVAVLRGSRPDLTRPGSRG